MNKKLLLLLASVCIAGRLLAQDTIVTMDGDRIPAREYKILQETEELEFQREDGKLKIMDLEDVFSIKEPGNKETVLYKLDSAQGSYLCADDMKCFLRGMEEAKEGYAATIATLGGFAAGIGSVAYAASSGAAVNIFWAPVIPIAYCVGVSMTRPSIEQIKRRYPEWSSNERYLAGYVSAARKKRITNALLSSLTGFVVATATYYIVQGADD